MISRFLMSGLAGALVAGIALKVVTTIPATSPFRGIAAIIFAACAALTVFLLWRALIRENREG